MPVSPPRKAEIEERRRTALIAARQGFSYRDIGRQLGISHEQARKDVEAALRETSRPPADAVRKLHVMRTEWVYQKAATIAHNSTSDDRTLRALDRCLQALERLAKLDGVDAPSRAELTILSLDAIEAEIAQLEAKLGTGELEDGIVDAEVIEDD